MVPALAGIKSLGTPALFVDRSKPKRLEELKNPVFQRTCTINASRMIPCVACTFPYVSRHAHTVNQACVFVLHESVRERRRF